MLRKLLCFILFFCFVLKNVTFALHPFASHNTDALSALKDAAVNNEFSLPGFFSTLSGVDTRNNNHKLLRHKLDKQLSSQQQFQLKIILQKVVVNMLIKTRQQGH